MGIFPPELSKGAKQIQPSLHMSCVSLLIKQCLRLQYLTSQDHAHSHTHTHTTHHCGIESVCHFCFLEWQMVPIWSYIGPGIKPKDSNAVHMLLTVCKAGYCTASFDVFSEKMLLRSIRYAENAAVRTLNSK